MYSMCRRVTLTTNLIALLALVGASTADAAAPKKMASVEPPRRPDVVNAMQVAQPERPECKKVRRRFFLQDQGWIIRQVSICS
jgi:hypothetical protein